MFNLFAKTRTPEDKNLILRSDREALFQKLAETTKTAYQYDQLQHLYDQLINYLHDGSVGPPIFPYGLYGRDLYNSYWALLGPDPRRWDDVDERVLAFAFTASSGSYLTEDFFQVWLTEWLTTNVSRADIDVLTAKLAAAGETEPAFWSDILRYVSVHYRPDSAMAQWVVERVEPFHTSQFPNLGYQVVPYLKLLLKQKPHFVKNHLADFLGLRSNYQSGFSVDTDIIEALLESEAAYFGPQVAAALKRITHPENYRAVQRLLAQYLPSQYQADTVTAAYDYLEWLRHRMTTSSIQNYYLFSSEHVKSKNSYELTVQVLFDQLLRQEEPTKARDYIYRWLSDCPTPDSRLFTFLSERLGPESVPYLMLGLQVNPRGAYFNTADLAKSVLKLLVQYDYSPYYAQIWAMTRYKSKQMRELAAVTLAKLGETAIPEAEKLLNDKKADLRQTGALILSLVRTDRAQTLLMNALDAEKNDDARDLILNGLTGLLPTPATVDELTAMIQKAAKRGKLDAPAAPYLLEKNLPLLHWKTSGEPLDATAVRFLLYRQNRSKDIRPDLEARPMYDLIDRQRSAPFARAVLKAYFEGGADPKLKGCLTIGAMLGSDDEIDLLKTKVSQWADAGRGKMAEYAVQALALIGSSKALRAVEYYTRKYKNKNKNIGAAANEAFTIAAETLGISAYDLADSIIPDFGFEGLFREFEAEGEAYRAFVGTDFKLAFLNEDNKLLKTIPKAATTELKDEFKEIGKEIRDIVKAQSGRLEQYLVTQRKWPAENWQRFFMGNPIMFAYAVRLIWGAFDAKQNLLFTFQCLEDQTLVDVVGDEIELAENIQIGMVHPLSLDTDQIAYWTDQLTEAGIEPIFPQLTRRVVALPTEAQNLTIDRQFEGVEYGGYGFISKMEKLGWFRGSVQDAGWIASYYKDFTDVGITAILTQQGNIGVGYYDENAALSELMFARAKTVTFGNYMYDEPQKEADSRLIPFIDVPPIVYSEVMADLLFFKENDARKKENQHD
jgi:hypothetical protein